MGAVLESGPVGFAGHIITPESDDYAAASRNALTGGAPAAILRPRDVDDVRRAVCFAAASRLPLAVRGGGHSAAGLGMADGGIVIDLRALDQVAVEPGGRVRVGGGALWRQVAGALAQHGLAVSSGDTADVGVGGLTLSGGIGWMVRSHGLTLDHLRAVEIVTAAGEVLIADAAHHPDLFWAVRGGGGAYGVVTAFEFQARTVPDVAHAELTFPASEATRIVSAWTRAMRTAPQGISSTLVLADPLAGGIEAPVRITLVRSDGEDLDETIAHLADAATLLAGEQTRRSYLDILHPGVELPAGLRASVRNAFVPAGTADAAALTVARLACEPQPAAIVLHSLGGAFGEVPAEATAFAHRDAELMITTFAVSPEATAGAVRDRLNLFWDELGPHVRGAYANSLDGTSHEAVADVYPGATLSRLATVKSAYDPQALFTRHFGPSGVGR
ncbi:FAD-binding oxidoreductase [Microbacterium sp. YJN-G]|uniref:FAD-binding oxidoreductase n=1 Tax=Microbacterium sp. YJN-G TaxID=2763257 RepID=UPI0018786C13|nr:FAD-binding oxidoreductase [Microbacterium sp. YJN-G]